MKFDKLHLVRNMLRPLETPVEQDLPVRYTFEISQTSPETPALAVARCTLLSLYGKESNLEREIGDLVAAAVDGDAASAKNAISYCQKIVPIEIVGQREEAAVCTIVQNRANAAAEFDKRLADFCSDVKLPPDYVSALMPILERYNLADIREPSPCRGSVDLLSSVIGSVENQTKRKYYYDHFEVVARTVWGWEYPRLTNEQVCAIKQDYLQMQRQIQASYSETCKTNPHKVYRLLWHFGRAGVEHNPAMFRLPKTKTSIQRNTTMCGAH